MMRCSQPTFRIRGARFTAPQVWILLTVVGGLVLGTMAWYPSRVAGDDSLRRLSESIASGELPRALDAAHKVSAIVSRESKTELAAENEVEERLVPALVRGLASNNKELRRACARVLWELSPAGRSHASDVVETFVTLALGGSKFDKSTTLFLIQTLAKYGSEMRDVTSSALLRVVTLCPETGTAVEAAAGLCRIGESGKLEAVVDGGATAEVKCVIVDGFESASVRSSVIIAASIEMLSSIRDVERVAAVRYLVKVAASSSEVSSLLDKGCSDAARGVKQFTVLGTPRLWSVAIELRPRIVACLHAALLDSDPEVRSSALASLEHFDAIPPTLRADLLRIASEDVDTVRSAEAARLLRR